MADRYDILIWCMMIIPIVFLGSSLLTHPTYLYTEAHISEDTVDENELKQILSENEWNDYIETKAEIVKIDNKKSTQNNQNTCTCESDDKTKNKEDYPTAASVVFYHELDQDQKRLFSYLQSSQNNSINRRIYQGDSFLYEYPQYNYRSYNVNGTIYTYNDIKPFLENSVIENSNNSYYIIEKTSTKKGKYTYLNDADYTFLLFFSFGFLMDYLNTVLKRNSRNKKKTKNSQSSSSSSKDKNVKSESEEPNEINVRDSDDLIDSENESDFDDLDQ